MALVRSTLDGVVPLIVLAIVGALWNIDLQTSLQWQGSSVILQHDDRLELRRKALAHKVIVAYNGLRLCRLKIGILKETRAEDIHQKAHGRLLEAGTNDLLAILLLAEFIGLVNMLRGVYAAILIDTRHQYFEVTLGDRHRLQAPRLTRVAVEVCVLANNTPIGADNTLVVVLRAEQILDDIVTVTIRHILTRGVLII